MIIPYQNNMKKNYQNKYIDKNTINSYKKNSKNYNTGGTYMNSNEQPDIEENPFVKYFSFTYFYGIDANHIDGTFDVDNYFNNESTKPLKIENFSIALRFFVEIKCYKDVKNILNKLINFSIAKWNGIVINDLFKAVSFLKYDCNLPENEYIYHRELLEMVIKSIPLDTLKIDAENIVDCLYNNRLPQIDNFKNDYQPSNTFFDIFVLEALYQGMLPSLEEKIRKNFKENIWNNAKLFKKIISNTSKNKNDGIEYIIMSSLYLGRHLSLKEKKLLECLNEALDGKYKISLEKVNKDGVTSSGYKLLEKSEIDVNDIQKLEKIFSNYMSKDDITFKYGFKIDDLKKGLSFAYELKKKRFKNYESKYYAVVVDGLNIFHRTDESFLIKIISNMKVIFSNVLFVTRPLKTQFLYRIIKDNGAYFINVPKNCNDDIFTICITLALGKDAFLLSNDKFNDFLKDISEESNNNIPIFNKWISCRQARWSAHGNNIVLPPKYNAIVQGNFKTPFQVHFPIIYENNDTISNYRVEEWYYLHKV
uniref:PRORP domain-containing protein n=1 Tax=Strongyloides venezuelensis TaxID=75913 RepID=A0A0K0FIB8_STRVS